MDAKEFKKLLKDIKFPGGAGTRVTATSADWEKRHGHAGARVLARVSANARAHGFSISHASVGTDPTGDRVSRGADLTKTLPDGTVIELLLGSYYGQTAYENSFSIHVRVKA